MKKNSTRSKKSPDEAKKCAIGRQYDGVSCSNEDEVRDMAVAWNKYVNMKMLNKKPINIFTDKKGLIIQLTDRLKDVCDDQLCWISHEFIEYAKMKHDIKKKTYLPEGPEGQFDWLSTSNINEYIDQLHAIFPDYKYLGAVPIDFDDIPAYGIHDLNFNKLYKDGIRRIGVVFNTDTSKGKGQHWISLFVDLKEKKIYFFDSCGREPDMRIVAFIDRIAKWMLKKHYKEEINPDAPYMRRSGKNNIEESGKLDIRWNNVVHQKGNTECGVYCMHWQTAMLQGTTFDKYNSKRIPDDEMNKFRNKFFTIRK